MVQVPWHDVIEILPSAGRDNTLTVLGRPIDCPPEKNLVMKAARAMQARWPIPPVDIIIEKIIPDGAGLGGGSGDAAATIRLLNDMFALGLSKAEMHEVAAQLGADCPLFIYDEPMLATGTGTTLAPISLDLKGYAILIAKPCGVSISTKQAYAGITPKAPLRDLGALLALPVDQWQGKVKNDFEDSIFPLAPAVGEIKQILMANGAIYASMSGSGAALYGIYPDEQAAGRALSAIKHPTDHKIVIL